MVGTSGKPVTCSRTHRVDDRARVRERSLEDDRGARPKGRRELAEAVGKGQRQDIQNDIVRRVLEIGADGGGRRHHVGVAEHDALGSAGRARRIDQRGEIGIVMSLFRGDRRGAGRDRRPRRMPTARPSGQSVSGPDRPRRRSSTEVSCGQRAASASICPPRAISAAAPLSARIWVRCRVVV